MLSPANLELILEEHRKGERSLPSYDECVSVLMQMQYLDFQLTELSKEVSELKIKTMVDPLIDAKAKEFALIVKAERQEQANVLLARAKSMGDAIGRAEARNAKP